MKKRTFDIAVVIFSAVALLTLNHFGLLENMAKFMVVPIVAFYFLGQYTQRKFSK